MAHLRGEGWLVRAQSTGIALKGLHVQFVSKSTTALLGRSETSSELHLVGPSVMSSQHYRVNQETCDLSDI